MTGGQGRGMAALLEIPALNPILPYFPGGIGNIRQFAVRAFCSEAVPGSHQENAIWQTYTNSRGNRPMAFERFPMRKGSRDKFVG
jgi:hypothetical protein